MKERKAKRFMLTAILALNKTYAEIKRLKDIKEVLERSGLEPEAYKIEQKIREQLHTLDSLKEAVMLQRDDLVRMMLLAFAAGDIATTAADKLSEAFDRHTVGADNVGGNELAKMCREQATAWNKFVQMIDGDGISGNERVSSYYADIAEEICETVIPVVLEIIDRHMKTDKGKRLL